MLALFNIFRLLRLQILPTRPEESHREFRRLHPSYEYM